MLNTQQMQPTRRAMLKWLSSVAAAAGVSGSLPAGASMRAAEESSSAGMSGAALWSDFCDDLKKAGLQLSREEVPHDALTQTEGLRYLTRLLRVSLEQSMESSDRLFPVFYQLSHESVKIGFDNPDNTYLNAQVDGRYSYRISGERGSVDYIGFSSKAGSYGETGGLEDTGFIDTDTLEVDPGGRFELHVSREPRPGNWLPLSQESRMIIVRQTFLDRGRETPAQMSIECLDGPAEPAPMDPGAVAAQLLGASAFVAGTARLFADWCERFARNPNRFTQEDQAIYQAAGGDPSIFYAYGYWELGEDDALLIEIAKTQAHFWNLVIHNYWAESLDYRHFQVHLNKRKAEYNDDGSVSVVLAHRDPGMPNWLNTTGHRLGTIIYREIRGTSPQYPSTRLIHLGDA